MASSIPAFATRSRPVAEPRRGVAFSRRLLGNQAAAIGLTIVVVYILLALTADWTEQVSSLHIGSAELPGICSDSTVSKSVPVQVEARKLPPGSAGQVCHQYAFSGPAAAFSCRWGSAPRRSGTSAG